jgi:hypothetical protein
MCTDSVTCRAFVVKYFGGIVMPQIMMYINQVSLQLDMWGGLGTYGISDDPNVGFRGNVTYKSMYGTIYYPNATLYSDSNLWAGL